MSKVAFFVLAIVLVLASQAEAGYGQGHGGTLGSQGSVGSGLIVGGPLHKGDGQYGQGGQVSHTQPGSHGSHTHASGHY